MALGDAIILPPFDFGDGAACPSVPDASQYSTKLTNDDFNALKKAIPKDEIKFEQVPCTAAFSDLGGLPNPDGTVPGSILNPVAKFLYLTGPEAYAALRARAGDNVLCGCLMKMTEEDSTIRDAYGGVFRCRHGPVRVWESAHGGPRFCFLQRGGFRCRPWPCRRVCGDPARLRPALAPGAPRQGDCERGPGTACYARFSTEASGSGRRRRSTQGGSDVGVGGKEISIEWSSIETYMDGPNTILAVNFFCEEVNSEMPSPEMFTVRASTDSAKRSASFLIPQGCVSGVFYQLVVVPNTFDPVFSQNNYPRSLIGIKEEVPFCAGTKLVSDTQKAFPLVAAVSPATVGNLSRPTVPSTEFFSMEELATCL